MKWVLTSAHRYAVKCFYVFMLQGKRKHLITFLTVPDYHQSHVGHSRRLQEPS